MSSERIDRAELKIAASTDVLYRAFLEPSLLEKWPPPIGMSGKLHEIDAFIGGGYVMSLYQIDQIPSGPGKTTDREDIFRVVFDELLPGRQIVQRVVFDATDPGFTGAMKQTWTFQSFGQMTTVSVACENVPSGIRPEDHAIGLNASLLNIANAIKTS